MDSSCKDIAVPVQCAASVSVSLSCSAHLVSTQVLDMDSKHSLPAAVIPEIVSEQADQPEDPSAPSAQTPPACLPPDVDQTPPACLPPDVDQTPPACLPPDVDQTPPACLPPDVDQTPPACLPPDVDQTPPACLPPDVDQTPPACLPPDVDQTPPACLPPDVDQTPPADTACLPAPWCGPDTACLPAPWCGSDTACLPAPWCGPDTACLPAPWCGPDTACLPAPWCGPDTACLPAPWCGPDTACLPAPWCGSDTACLPAPWCGPDTACLPAPWCGSAPVGADTAMWFPCRRLLPVGLPKRLGLPLPVPSWEYQSRVPVILLSPKFCGALCSGQSFSLYSPWRWLLHQHWRDLLRTPPWTRRLWCSSPCYLPRPDCGGQELFCAQKGGDNHGHLPERTECPEVPAATPQCCGCAWGNLYWRMGDECLHCDAVRWGWESPGLHAELQLLHACGACHRLHQPDRCRPRPHPLQETYPHGHQASQLYRRHDGWAAPHPAHHRLWSQRYGRCTLECLGPWHSALPSPRAVSW